MVFSKLLELGNIIDNAIDNENEEELYTIIGINSEYVETLSDTKEKSYLYYLLGNAWSAIRTLNHYNDESSAWKLEQIEVFKEIYYFRKSILQSGFNDLDLQFKISIYTNLGNVFSHYGRSINALKYYNKALELDPDFFMALVNKAQCLETYSKLNYDYSHKALILRYAYFEYKKSDEQINKHLQSNSHDFVYYQNILHSIRQTIEEIENHLSIEWIEEEIDLNQYKMRNYKNEKLYRNWVLNNTLFLNPMNDLGSINIATHDPLNLPDLKTKKLGFPKYITYFNQLKQEFITYRHLFYEGLNSSASDFYDKDTSITDDYDYNIYSIHTEKLKLSYRGFYSLFDKVAYFLNDYLELGKDENRVNFRTIWNDGKNLNSKFNDLNNIAIRGLYLISKDLYFNNNEDNDIFKALEPEADKIDKIRNHLEHKFIMIKHLDIAKYKIISERERSFSITEEEFIEKTIYLAKLIREAIIYLSFSVHIEEQKKSESEKYLDINYLQSSNI